MEKIGKFINVLQTINVSSIPYYYSIKDRSICKEKITENEKHLYEEEYLYLITIKKESEIRALYNETRISLTDLSQEQLKNRLKLLQTYQYKKLYEGLVIFNEKYNNNNNRENIWHEEKHLKTVLRKHLIGNIPLLGRFTIRFLCGLTNELQSYFKYMEAIKNDIETLLDEDNTKHVAINDINVPSLQYSLNPNTETTMYNDNNCDIDFYAILDHALKYINDFVEMKEYFKRENENAKENYRYINDSFYKEILRVVIKEREKTCLELRINKKNLGKYLSLNEEQLPKLRCNLAEIERFIQKINEVRFEAVLKKIKDKATFKNSTTISQKVKELLYFLEFLHISTANFKECNTILKEREQLFLIKEGIEKSDSAIRKLDLPEIEASIQSKSEALYINVEEPIKVMANNLNICDWSSSKNIMKLKISDIEELQKNYSAEDVKTIHEYEQKLTEYRRNVVSDFICFDFLIDLDKILLHLFSFFRDKEVKQFVDVINFDTQENEQQIQQKRKLGRPRSQQKDASNYLLNKNLLPFLIENYSNVKPRVFNQLIKVLVDLQQLKEAENKEYKEAFGKALNVQQAQFNFDKAFNKAPNPNLFDPIKAKIQTYLGE